MRSRAEQQVLLATRSEDKAREIREIVAPFTRARIITLAEAGVAATAAEEELEIYDTFLDNAHAKATYFLRISGLPTIADDSGICVDALNGRPGVRSKRFASTPNLNGVELDRANNARLLEELAGVSPEQRTAHYTCAAVLHTPDARKFAALGTCSGRILEAPRGHEGFGYDPLFLDPVTALSFGEMDPREKNAKSHRARAFRALAAQL